LEKAQTFSFLKIRRRGEKDEFYSIKSQNCSDQSPAYARACFNWRPANSIAATTVRLVERGFNIAKP
jgi:hypothetical protein